MEKVLPLLLLVGREIWNDASWVIEGEFSANTSPTS